ncbi:MAG: IS1 family transposase [Chlamydiales bacterium]|nr:IS1 family transposase [Chlamydiia bacterium]MCP5507673.1 IS1 family transposase [Chlamydiales bacterium]
MDKQCPRCSSKAFKRNGYTRHGKQNYRCLECGRQFSLTEETTSIANDEQSKSSNIETYGYCV